MHHKGWSVDDDYDDLNDFGYPPDSDEKKIDEHSEW